MKLDYDIILDSDKILGKDSKGNKANKANKISKEIFNKINNNIRELMFFKKDPPSGSGSLNNFVKNYAGLFTSSILEGAAKNTKMFSKKIVSVKRTRDATTLDVKLDLSEKGQNKYTAKDPAKYILEDATNIDNQRARQIFDDVLRRA